MNKIFKKDKIVK